MWIKPQIQKSFELWEFICFCVTSNLSIDLLPHQADGMDQNLRGDFTGTWKSSLHSIIWFYIKIGICIIVVLQYWWWRGQWRRWWWVMIREGSGPIVNIGRRVINDSGPTSCAKEKSSYGCFLDHPLLPNQPTILWLQSLIASLSISLINPIIKLDHYHPVNKARCIVKYQSI